MSKYINLIRIVVDIQDLRAKLNGQSEDAVGLLNELEAKFLQFSYKLTECATDANTTSQTFSEKYTQIKKELGINEPLIHKLYETFANVTCQKDAEALIKNIDEVRKYAPTEKLNGDRDIKEQKSIFSPQVADLLQNINRKESELIKLSNEFTKLISEQATILNASLSVSDSLTAKIAQLQLNIDDDANKNKIDLLGRLRKKILLSCAGKSEYKLDDANNDYKKVEDPLPKTVVANEILKKIIEFNKAIKDANEKLKAHYACNEKSNRFEKAKIDAKSKSSLKFMESQARDILTIANNILTDDAAAMALCKSYENRHKNKSVFEQSCSAYIKYTDVEMAELGRVYNEYEKYANQDADKINDKGLRESQEKLIADSKMQADKIPQILDPEVKEKPEPGEFNTVAQELGRRKQKIELLKPLFEIYLGQNENSLYTRVGKVDKNQFEGSVGDLKYQTILDDLDEVRGELLEEIDKPDTGLVQTEVDKFKDRLSALEVKFENLQQEPETFEDAFSVASSATSSQQSRRTRRSTSNQNSQREASSKDQNTQSGVADLRLTDEPVSFTDNSVPDSVVPVRQNASPVRDAAQEETSALDVLKEIINDEAFWNLKVHFSISRAPTGIKAMRQAIADNGENLSSTLSEIAKQRLSSLTGFKGVLFGKNRDPFTHYFYKACEMLKEGSDNRSIKEERCYKFIVDQYNHFVALRADRQRPDMR